MREVERANAGSLRAAQNFLRLGQVEQAENELLELTKRDPENLESRFILGLICCQSQRWREAAEYLELVAVRQSDRFEALYWLGLARKELGEFSHASSLLKKAAALSPRHVATLNELGLCYLAVSDPSSALVAFDRALSLNPQAPPLLHNRGLALATLDRVYEARDAFVAALKLGPIRADSYVQLALQLERLGEWESCISHLERGLTYLPDNPALLALLAGAYSQNLDREAAERTFKRGIERNPATGVTYGLWLQEMGRFSESVEVLSDSLKRLPTQGSAYYGLVEAKQYALDGVPLLESARKVLADPKLEEKERVYLEFAVGKLLEKEGEFEQAMSAFDTANQSAFREHNAGRPYNHELLREITDRRISRFSVEFLSETEDDDVKALQPIFIVGMIRSGTTLLDQILSSHPSVGTAGEQNYWMTQADLLRQKNDPPLDRRQCDQLRTGYRAVLTKFGGSAPRIIDKMPLNYAYLGLIHKVFPRAKIVHIRRNPLDTCISIYTTYLGKGPNFAYNQANIVFNYREYLRLMEHWRRALPAGSFHELNYEDLVADRESETRRVVDFSELPWDDACLHHAENESSIRTPSRWQARQQVYKTSVGRWKKYEPWLGDLRALRDVTTT